MYKTLFRWTAPLLVGVMLSGPAFAGASIATNPAPASAPRQPAAPATSATPATEAPAAAQLRYQDRETVSAGLEGWKGGDGISVYLGGSALALVVLILVLLVLL